MVEDKKCSQGLKERGEKEKDRQMRGKRRWWGSGRGREARDSKRCSKTKRKQKRLAYKSRSKPNTGKYGQ